MTHGTLLRIGIYLIGVWALLTAVTHGAYYTLELIDRWGSASDLYRAPSWSALFAYGAFPLVFAVGAFGFARSIQRLLLGREGEAGIDRASLNRHQLLVIGLRLLGIYFLVTYLPGLASNLVEILIDRARSHLPVAPDLTSSFVYNLVGTLLALVLCTKTDKLMAKLGFGPTEKPAGTAPAP
jgi:hypothetical protein